MQPAGNIGSPESCWSSSMHRSRAHVEVQDVRGPKGSYLCSIVTDSVVFSKGGDLCDKVYGHKNSEYFRAWKGGTRRGKMPKARAELLLIVNRYVS